MASTYVISEPLANSTPGFSFGRSGACNAGTYLQVDGVPSNLAGRIVPFSTSELAYVFVSCQEDSTFDLEIQTRSGVTFTTVYTLSVSAARTATAEVSDVLFAFGDEVSVKIGSGSTANVVVGLILKGNGYG